MRRKKVWRRIIASGLTALLLISEPNLTLAAETSDTEPDQETDSAVEKPTADEEGADDALEESELISDDARPNESDEEVIEPAEPGIDGANAAEAKSDRDEKLTAEFQRTWTPGETACPALEELLTAKEEAEAQAEAAEMEPEEAGYFLLLDDDFEKRIYGNLREAFDAAFAEDADHVMRAAFSLEDFETEGSEPEEDFLQEYDTDYETALQHVFEAFWYDEPNSDWIDWQNSVVTVTYSGEKGEESWHWSVSAEWEAECIYEEEELASVMGELSEMSGCHAFEEEVAKEEIQAVLQEDLYVCFSSSEEEVGEERLARIFQYLCGEYGVSCLRLADKEADENDEDICHYWNAVSTDGENWTEINLYEQFTERMAQPAEEEIPAAEAQTISEPDGAEAAAIQRKWDSIQNVDYAEEYAHTGAPIEAAPYSVSLTDGTLLSRNKDYRVRYKKAGGEDYIPVVIDCGSYEMYLDGIEGTVYEGLVSDPYPFTVGNWRDLSAVTISEAVDQAYTGGEICPPVKLTDGKTVLQQDKQYTLDYENNTELGTSVIRIRAVKGSGYAGERIVEFQILPHSLSASDIVLTKDADSYEYTGEAVCPPWTLSHGTKQLMAETDYKVSYRSNKSRGTATVVYTGLGNYQGIRTTTFRIVARSLTSQGMSVNVEDSVDLGKTPTVKVTYNTAELVKNKDYKVSFVPSVTQGAGKATVTGIGNYTSSVVKSYRIIKPSIEADAEVEFEHWWSYMGKSVPAAPTSVMVSGKTLKAGKDYYIRYQNEKGELLLAVKELGTYQLLIVGTGNYEGSISLPFEITEKPLLRKMSTNVAASYMYNGKEQKPPVELEVTNPLNGGKELTPDVDYTVAFAEDGDYTNAGTASFTLEAVDGSDYVGEKKVSFRITPHPLSEDDITVEPLTEYMYTGRPIEPDPVIKMGEKHLGKDVDYQVKYYDNVEIGQAKAVISGVGNYSGEREVEFKIQKEQPFPDTVTFKVGEAPVYTGEPLEANITVLDDGTVLQENIDYKVEYRNNVNAGVDTTAIIRGIEASGHKGMHEEQFSIAPRNISDKDVTAEMAENWRAGSGRQATLMEKVIYKDQELEPEVDYHAEFLNSGDGDGSVTMKITGIGNFTGEKEISYERKSLTESTVEAELEYVETEYTGSELMPKADVWDGETKLEEGRHYVISYGDNNVDHGTVTATITGIGLYYGAITKEFKILPVDINKTTISPLEEYSYWKFKDLDVELHYNGMKLEKGEDKDYTVVLDLAQLDPGKENAFTIKGHGNYSGEVMRTVMIKDLNKDKLNVEWCRILTDEEGISSDDPFEIELALKDLELSSMEGQKCSLIRVSNTGDTNTVWENLNADIFLAEGKSGGNSKVVHARISYTDRHDLEEKLMSKYALAINITIKGEIHSLTSNAVYIENPEAKAETRNTYQGFYEGKVTSKKGMQGRHSNAIDELGVQASLENFYLNEMIKTSANVRKYTAAAYQPYEYNGTTYYFLDMEGIQQGIYNLNGWESDPKTGYLQICRNVSLNLLLKWDNELTYLIHPSARSAGKSYYTLNMAEPRARETFEAMFSYMAEKLGGSMPLKKDSDSKKYRVSNWVLGNEVNCCQAWNYSGNLSTQACANNYAEAFQLLYQAVKKADSEARVFISLDHSWNDATHGHSSKAYLDQFAKYMHETAPWMRWNVNFHPYSQPLTRNDFWNDGSNTTSSVGTRYISMKNLNVLTNYLEILETKYEIPEERNIRVILGEQGYIAAGKSAEPLQAAAIAYEFYLASMNTKVDAMVNRAFKDDPAEGVMTLGVMYQSEKKKEAYYVFRDMDKPEAFIAGKAEYNRVNGYASKVNGGKRTWTAIISGLSVDQVYKE